MLTAMKMTSNVFIHAQN